MRTGWYRSSSSAGRIASALGFLLGASGCPAEPASSSLPGRVEAIRPTPVTGADLDGFCDKRWAVTDAPSLTFPALSTAVPQPSGWRWVNLWATWCKPCIAEMPLLGEWRRQLSDSGVALDLLYISVDENEAELRSFYARHPKIPRGPRLLQPTELAVWLDTMGLGESAALPVHVIADPENRVRCVRAGGLADHHLRLVRALLAGGV